MRRAGAGPNPNGIEAGLRRDHYRRRSFLRGACLHAVGTFLDLDEAGELQPQSSAGASGTWVVSWEESLQVWLDMGGFGDYLFFTFQEDPGAMRVTQTVGYGDYVRVE